MGFLFTDLKNKIMDDRRDLIEKIINELNGRSGFDDWWYNIDEDTQKEITENLINILPTGNCLFI